MTAPKMSAEREAEVKDAVRMIQHYSFMLGACAKKDADGYRADLVKERTRLFRLLGLSE